MPATIEYTKIRHDPPVTNPRNAWLEGAKAITLLIKELCAGKVDPKFVRPSLKLISEDELFDQPAVFPAMDVRWVSEGECEVRGTGLVNVHEIWPETYAVRYYHCIGVKRLNKKEVLHNLYGIRDYLKHRNDLHGLCRTRRSKILGCDANEMVFGQDTRAGFVAGGAIILRAYIDVHYTYYDGKSPRDVVFASGARH